MTLPPRHMVRGEEPLDRVGLPVGVDHADVRVSSGRSIKPRKDSLEMREQDAIHAAVADDEDGLAGALAREALDRAQCACDDLVERLPTRPRDEAIVVPVRHTHGLIEGLAGALAD